MLYVEKNRFLLFALISFAVSTLLFCSDDNISGNDPVVPPKATVKAIVTDSSTTSPIEGSAVVIFNAITDSAVANGTTDSLGFCFLVVNANTSYYLNVSANGFMPYPATGASPDTFQVVENDTTYQAIALTKIDTPAVVKAVISEDSTKTPIENASIVIYKAATGQPFANGLSDSLGVCLLEVEKGFSYYLNVSAAGYNPYPEAGAAPDTFDVTGTDTTAQAIALTKIDTPTVVKAVIDNDSTSAPVKNAGVIIYKEGTSQPFASGISDSLGVCFLVVEEGFSYYLRVTALGYLPYPLPGTTPDTFQVVEKDTTVRAISLTPIDTLTFVKVAVTDDSTAVPIESARVTIFNDSTNQVVGNTVSDNLGICFFVVEGGLSYYLWVSADGYYTNPLPYVSPDSFYVAKYDTTMRDIKLKKKSSQTIVIVNVKEDTTHIPIKDADVVIFDTYTNQAFSRAMTDAEGRCLFFVQPNLPYHLKVSAQNYRSSPPPNGAPVPFLVGDSGSVMEQEVILRKDYLAVNCGTISGYVQSTSGDFLAGCLNIAIRPSDSITVSGLSGPDGFYILYNVPAGTYNMEGYLEGWHQTTPVTGVQVTAGNVTIDVNFQMAVNYGSSLEGRITFLASQNSQIDITLAHPVSHEAIPGLNTFMQGNQSYFLDSIPPGTYIPWASYFNDGYVMDPDWIRKFGLPMMTFVLGDNTKTLNFSVTGAVPIISPTNHPDTLVPFNIMTATPTFKWEIYPSTQEYIVGVYNSYGDLIWGGYDTSNNVLHPQLGSKTDSVVFNFDSSATESLKWFHSYRWKVWADKDAAPGVQQLISSSEDWLGLFMIGEKKRKK